MKHISILEPKGAPVLSCIEGSFIAFTMTNEFLKTMGKPPLFNVQLVGLNNDACVYHKLFTVSPDITIEEVLKTNLVIIPAVNGEMDVVISMNKDFLPW